RCDKPLAKMYRLSSGAGLAPGNERMLTGALVLLAGQFAFFEVQPGLTAGEEPAVGPSLAFETGVGGAWRNSRPRFFLAARYERSGVEFTGADVSHRSYDDLSLGLRLLIPIAEPVRIYFDLLLGGTHAEARLERDGLPMLESERWRPLGQLALGLQVRPLT